MKKVGDGSHKEGRGPALAPRDCPQRNKCRMYVSYCRKCEEFLTCEIWKEEK